MLPKFSPLLTLINWLQAHTVIRWLVILFLIPVAFCIIIYIPVGLFKRAKLSRAREKLRPFAAALLEEAADRSGCGSLEAFARQFTFLDVDSAFLQWEVRGEGGPRTGTIDYFGDMKVSLDITDQGEQKLRSLADYLSAMLPAPTRVESKGSEHHTFRYDPVAVTTVSADGKRAVTTAEYAHVGGYDIHKGFLILPANAPRGAGRKQEDAVLRI